MRGQIVEGRCRVGLGPEADLAALWDGGVFGRQHGLAVETADDLIADHLDAERVPLTSLELDLRGGELLSLAVEDLVEAVVVLERVDATDVVVLLFLASPDGSAALVDLSGDGLDADAEGDVLA
ncbi:MAG: hypothetical protein JXQ73_13320 [Phycisphaerae bacterium]|nr:hypothetical protein [Phycisphaerae bacterium]